MKTDPLKNLRRKLMLFNPEEPLIGTDYGSKRWRFKVKRWRSKFKTKRAKNNGKRLKSLVVSSIFTNTSLVTTCPPKSLQRWLNINNDKNSTVCDVNIEDTDFARSTLYIEQ